MVEYFTNETDTELSSETEMEIGSINEVFETKLRTNLKALVKDPTQSSIENILNFSKSLRK
ncbi:hypothetical protein SAMN05660206_107115 [Sphingobacterium wenxiniae]|uniref:Uncharacterized protein n=1 Tax=Sphingobacterium wenxiniae TaxID=683125 RepID=A0A1I6TXD7_9SPHI|nr:hypothetical protein SAMN05660206_107115 [Sphingobacterium wenxiniae]